MGNAEQPSDNAQIVPDAITLSHDPAFIEFAQQILGGSEIADGLNPSQLAQLALIGELRTYEPNALICDEHAYGDELYIIGNGAVAIWLDPSSIGDTRAPRRIANLQAGQICGELTLLDGGVRSAQVRAGEQGTRLVAFTRDTLLALCENDTAIGYRLMRNLASTLALRLRLQDMRLYSAD